MTGVATDLDTIVAERAGVLALARAQCAKLDKLAAQRRLSAELATELKTGLRSFAEQIAQGLHREGDDPAGVQAAMTPLVKAAAA